MKITIEINFSSFPTQLSILLMGTRQKQLLLGYDILAETIFLIPLSHHYQE